MLYVSEILLCPRIRYLFFNADPICYQFRTHCNRVITGKTIVTLGKQQSHIMNKNIVVNAYLITKYCNGAIMDPLHKYRSDIHQILSSVASAFLNHIDSSDGTSMVNLSEFFFVLKSNRLIANRTKNFSQLNWIFESNLTSWRISNRI